MTERVLTPRELNRALLARQLLLERADLPPADALERIAGIQAQYAPSMYVGLWSRLQGFERDALTGALERREVIQGTLMRSTIHLVAPADYWPFALATRAARRAHWLRVYPEPGAAAMTGAARAVRRRIGDGTLSRREIETLVGKGRVNGVGLWTDLVRVPPSGTWERRRADLYGAASAWLGPPPRLTPTEAAEHLVRRYLAGFGPATAADIASFTGLPPAAIRRLLKRLELRRYRSEAGDELLDVPDGQLPDPETPAPPRFLPTWDATLLIHTRRSGVLPEAHRQKLFSSSYPQSFGSFLVDGEVAGIWHVEDGAIRLDPFGKLDRSARRALEAEAAPLAALHA